VVGTILFPWLFTIYVSAFDWRLGGAREWVGFANYQKLFTEERFGWAMLRTLFYTLLAVVFPLIFGVAAALIFNRELPLRGLARTIFILPIMATPVAVALVWTILFHPRLGALNWGWRRWVCRRACESTARIW
jgi:multiple sugar transport system permease protein